MARGQARAAVAPARRAHRQGRRDGPARGLLPRRGEGAASVPGDLPEAGRPDPETDARQGGRTEEVLTMALPLEPPIKPQLAKSAKELPEGDGWVYEPKWDGFRTIVFRDGD